MTTSPAFPTGRLKKVAQSQLRIAIVEDNGVARINLRNHLMAMGFELIGCYSHGRELRNAMRKQHFDLLIIDYHLGLNKNGVEVIQELQQSGLLQASVAVVFITSDRMPLVFGQIVDVHPDSVILKPYTIRNLKNVIQSTLIVRKKLQGVYDAMDQQDYQSAFETLMIIKENDPGLNRGATLTKLRARLLIKLGRFKEAAAIYEIILKQAEQVIWARWGLVMALYMDGQVERSMHYLEGMLDKNLTKDKACEWLARINIQQQDLEKAQDFLDRINESELTLSTARLKAHIYQLRDNVEGAINLLERKRESNRHFRERFADLSMDLARVYLSQAEADPERRDDALKLARLLISGNRRTMDEDLDQRRQYISALSHILEGDEEKAMALLQEDGMLDLDNSDIDTLVDAVQAWHSVGHDSVASELQQACEDRLSDLQDQNDKALAGLKISENESNLGDKKSRSLAFNKQGLDAFSSANPAAAIDHFYQAHILFPAEPAFLINLFDAMVSNQCPVHKRTSTQGILESLKNQNLSDTNKKRFSEIRKRMMRDIDIHHVDDPPPS